DRREQSAARPPGSGRRDHAGSVHPIRSRTPDRTHHGNRPGVRPRSTPPPDRTSTTTTPAQLGRGALLRVTPRSPRSPRPLDPRPAGVLEPRPLANPPDPRPPRPPENPPTKGLNSEMLALTPNLD